MPWPVTPLKEREERLRLALASRLGLDSDPGVFSNIGVLAAEIAAEIDDLHGRLDHEARQILTTTADRDSLLAQGRELGLPIRRASPARGRVVLEGLPGTVVPTGTLLRHSSGALYRTEYEATLPAQRSREARSRPEEQQPTTAGGLARSAVPATAAVPVLAESPGPEGNLPADARLAPLSPIEGLNPTITLQSAFAGGHPEENIELYRARILFRKAHPPMGGADADYVVWASMIPGVTHVWVFRHEMGLRTVTVRIAAWDDPEGPIPSEALRTEVLAHVNGHRNPITGQWTGRPAGAEVFVPALRARPLDLDFARLEPNSARLRQAIAKNVKQMLRDRARPGGTIRHSWITEAISRAAGEDHHQLISPAADVVLERGELATPGTLSLNGEEQTLGPLT